MRNRFFALAVTALFAAPQAQAQLIHHWDFSSGVVDLVGGATPVSNTASTSGGLLHLTNGGSPGWVDFGSQFLVPTSGNFTVSLTYRAQPGANFGYTELLSQGGAGSAFYIGAEFNQSQYRLGDQWQSSGYPFNADGNFHTLVYESIDGGTSKFFFDGALVASQALSPDLAASGSGLRIGRQYGANAEYINADIDDISIYGQALAPDEISSTPEPASLILLATGLAAAGALARRRRK